MNYNVSQIDNDFEFEMSLFPANQDSDILVRESARGAKVENVYKC